MVWQERVALQTLLFGQDTYYIVLTFSTFFTDWKKKFKTLNPDPLLHKWSGYKEIIRVLALLQSLILRQLFDGKEFNLVFFIFQYCIFYHLGSISFSAMSSFLTTDRCSLTDHHQPPKPLEGDLLTSVTTLQICDNIEDDDSDGVINVDGGSDDNRWR